MLTKLKSLALAATLLFAASCESGVDMVPTGSYTGTVDKADAKETEIYVKTEDGMRLELYFTEATVLTKNGQPATFDQLKAGTKVEVQVENKGSSLDPMAVNIVE